MRHSFREGESNPSFSHHSKQYFVPLSGKFRSADLLTPKANAIYEENLEWPTQDKLQVEVYHHDIISGVFKELKLIVVLRSSVFT